MGVSTEPFLFGGLISQGALTSSCTPASFESPDHLTLASSRTSESDSAAAHLQPPLVQQVPERFRWLKIPLGLGPHWQPTPQAGKRSEMEVMPRLKQHVHNSHQR